MGLDQRAYTKDKDGQQSEVAYWRKHNALDGWMEKLFRNKGNDGGWNCAELELTKEDIEHLEQDVKSDSLPETAGFFYGSDSRFCSDQKELTLEFIDNAKKLIQEDKKLYYGCSY